MAQRLSPAILALILVAAACGSTGPSPSPAAATGSPAASPGLAALTWIKGGLIEGGLIEQSGLSVPLDYADPSAGTITLAIARRPAADPAHRIGALFVNPGGPGYSGVNFLSWYASSMIPKAVFDRFDVVSWDPRGTGASQGLNCPDGATLGEIAALDPDPTSPDELGAWHTTLEDVRAQCSKADPRLLATMSTATTARDMDTIRIALGEPTVSYWGWSYGSYLGYLYATMFPTRLRAAVLDGPVDPTLDLVGLDISQGRAQDAALEHFLSVCSTAKACAFHGGANPSEAYDALIATLPHTASADGLDAGHIVVGVAYRLDDLAGLATALSQAERGDASALRADAEAYYQGFGSYLATICLDRRHPTSEGAIGDALAAAQEAAPRFGLVAAAPDLYGCLDWPVPAQPVAVGAPPAGLPPILVVASRWDPATPPWEAAPLAKALGTGVVLTRDGVGHTSGLSATTNACLRDALTAYLVTLTVPPAGTVCTDPPVSF